MNFDAETEKYIEHEVALRLHSQQFILQDEKFNLSLKHFDEKFTTLYNQLNNKLNVIMSFCGAIFTVVLIPIILHSFKLI